MYTVIVFFINTAIGSNYLMINGKAGTRPACWTCSPDWPVYILYMEGIGFVSLHPVISSVCHQGLEDKTET